MKFRGRAQKQVLADELSAHLEELTDALIGEGYAPEDARFEARRRFGNQTALLESSREVWSFPWLDAMRRDLLFTWRLARKQPWTMLAAILSIAIGIGANTAVTSIVDTVLLNPLGLKNADRLVAASVHIDKLQMADAETSGAELRDLESASIVFSKVAATEPRAWTLGGDQPTRLLGVAVTPGYFEVFGVTPQLGTWPGGATENAIVLSDGLWSSRYGRSSAVLGKKLLLDGKIYDVTGVAPAGFHYPATAEAWIPLILSPDRFKRGMNMSLSLYGRLKEGATIQQAQQRVDYEISKLRSTPDGLQMQKLGYGIDVAPLARKVAGDLRIPLLLLWSAAFVLLIAACANVAGLLMARGSSRRKEIGIRISVGAGKWQILRQLTTESLVLAAAGGCVGILLASFLLGVARNEPLPYQHVLALVTLNPRLLLYCAGLALFSSLLFGLAPALELLGNRHVEALARSRRRSFQHLYIVGQVGAAMLLLVVMGLLLKSLKAVTTIQPGFDSHNLTTAFMIKPSMHQELFYDRLLSALRANPAIQSAALAYPLPFAGGDISTSMFDIKSRHHQNGEPEWHGKAYQVTPDFFATLRIPLLRGRFIQESDTAQTPLVCVIDAGMAKRFFPNENPIGQEIAMYSGWARIVGVVGAVKDATLESQSRPVAYYALSQIPYFPQIGVVVRASIPAPAMIRSAVASADPQIPVFDVKTMDRRISDSQATRSVLTLLVGAFAGISVLLAMVGIHGVISQVVTERTSEIGIRMALGARSGNIFSRYVWQGLQLSIAGVFLGLCAAAACSGLLRSLLYQAKPIDPYIMLLGAAGVVLLSTLAVITPAWRASRVDPQIALRTE